jgi:hypothetical protein
MSNGQSIRYKQRRSCLGRKVHNQITEEYQTENCISLPRPTTEGEEESHALKLLQCCIVAFVKLLLVWLAQSQTA